MISNCWESDEVIGETGKQYFDMGTGLSGNIQMAGVEHASDDTKRQFDQRTHPANRSVPPIIFRGDRITLDRSPHGFIHRREKNGPERSFVW